MTRSVIVLGAGMVGVASALHLQRRGWSVVLIDRQEPGRATSHGNSGVIQNEAVEPYAMPRRLSQLLAIAARRTNDIHYHLRGLPSQINPLFQYWWHSAPQRYATIAAAYASLIAQAGPEHGVLIADAGAEHFIRRDGFRVLHRSLRRRDEAVAQAERLRGQYGVRSQYLSPAELMAAEPSLKDGGAGAIHWLDAWTVNDPGGLVRAYARLFVETGGVIRRAEATALRQGPHGWAAVTNDGLIEAETAVVALGPWSPQILQGLGYRFLMVRKRGYHRHWHDAATLNLPLLDMAHGYVLVPMVAGMRITTGAEIAHMDAPATPSQLAYAEQVARTLIDLGEARDERPWLGTRPCMPDMLPVVGEAPKHRGLWLHFGHGHQGFTLGPATGRLLAESMSGEPSFVDAAPFKPRRF
jgi:D-amino-acid dehydrogenase